MCSAPTRRATSRPTTATWPDPGQNVTLFRIVQGAVLHPSRVTHVLSQRWRAIVFELLPTGSSVSSRLGDFLLFLGLLVPVALTSSFAYSLATGGAFQNLPAMPFIFVGSVMVLTRLATWTPGGRGWIAERRGPLVATAIATVATVLALTQGAIMIHRVPHDWLLVSAPEAQTLENATAVIPSDAEVVVSYGVMGRFAERKYVLALAAAPQTFRVSTRHGVLRHNADARKRDARLQGRRSGHLVRACASWRQVADRRERRRRARVDGAGEHDDRRASWRPLGQILTRSRRGHRERIVRIPPDEAAPRRHSG